MLNFRSLFVCLVFALACFSARAQSFPKNNANTGYPVPVGYALSTVNDSPSGDAWQQQSVSTDFPIPVQYNSLYYTNGVAWWGQVQWNTVCLASGNMLWDGVSWGSLPYVPWLWLDTYNHASPPTPITIPGSAPGASTFALSPSAFAFSGGFWAMRVLPMGAGWWIPYFTATLDLPSDPGLVGWEISSQWVRQSINTGLFVWTSPRVVRIA